MAITRKQVEAAFAITAAYAEAIRALKEVPSGVLYAQLMPSGISLEGHQKIIDTLKRAGLVSESNHLLRWIGPELPTPEAN